MLPNTSHGKILLDAMVHLIRQVPWGESREALELKAQAFDREGSFESGWDNYSTAASLWWKSDLYQVAAQCRFPRENDKAARAMINALDERLHHEVSGYQDDSDVGERTRVTRYELSSALPEIPDGALKAELLEHYRVKGFLFAAGGPVPVSTRRGDDDFSDDDDDFSDDDHDFGCNDDDWDDAFVASGTYG